MHCIFVEELSRVKVEYEEAQGAFQKLKTSQVEGNSPWTESRTTVCCESALPGCGGV